MRTIRSLKEERLDARHWIKRRDEKGYFTNIVRELMIEGTTAYREMMRRSSDFMTSIG